MPLIELPAVAPGLAAAICRFAGVMLFAPVLGSGAVPKRVKVMFGIAMTIGLFAGGRVPPHVPSDVYSLTMGLAGEILFGFALGMCAAMVFVGAQWAGNAIGQQMGLGLASVFNPSAEMGGGAIEQIYFLLTLFIFLGIDGHRLLVMGVYESFDVLPPLTVGVDADVLNIIVGLLAAATNLTVRLGAPMFVAMLAVDLSLGFIAKGMPALNLLSAGLSLRALIGMAVIIIVMLSSARALSDALHEAITITFNLYTTARE